MFGHVYRNLFDDTEVICSPFVTLGLSDDGGDRMVVVPGISGGAVGVVAVIVVCTEQLEESNGITV